MTLALAVLLALSGPAGPQPTDDEPSVTPLLTLPEPTTDAPPPALTPPPPVPAPPPPVPAPPPLAPDAPQRPADTVDQTSPAQPPPPPVRPSASFGLEIGYAHGGDRYLASVGPSGITDSANAGDGPFFSLAGSWTPDWHTGGVGLGVYARAGAKRTAIGDDTGSASFVRFPLALGAQLLRPIGGRWYVLGRLGVLTEVLGQLTITSPGGSISETGFSPRLGQFLDAGLYWTPANFAGFAAIARYERIDISHDDHVTNASNLGALAAAYLRF